MDRSIHSALKTFQNCRLHALEKLAKIFILTKISEYASYYPVKCRRHGTKYLALNWRVRVHPKHPVYVSSFCHTRQTIATRGLLITTVVSYLMWYWHGSTINLKCSAWATRTLSEVREVLEQMMRLLISNTS